MSWDSSNFTTNDSTETEAEEVAEEITEEITDIEEAGTSTGTSAAKKKRPTRKRAQATGQLTKAQVASVLDTYQDVQEASKEALTVLKVVLREPDADHGELTAAILGADRADNPLATLAELRAALEENQFVAAATIAGMERTRRSRAYAALQAATGASDTLSAKDIDAAAAFAGALAALTDEEALALDEAHEVLGK